MEMRRRGHLEELVRKVTFANPERFLSQSGRFSAAPLRPTASDVTR
jgi:hypothetical protein